MKICLVLPPFNQTEFRSGESLGLKYLAAILEKNNHFVKIFEINLLKLPHDKFINEIKSINPDIIGFSIVTGKMLVTANHIIQQLKLNNINCHINMGGYFPSFNSHFILEEFQDVDTIVRFEGEYTLLELVNNLNNKDQWMTIKGLSFRREGSIIENHNRDLINNLDELPLPLRDNMSKFPGGNHYTILSSRGCNGNCTYCSVFSFHRIPNGLIWRCRSPQNVIDELVFLNSNYNANIFTFIDDNFIGPTRESKSRLFHLSNEIIKNKLQINWAINCRTNDVDFELFHLLKKAGLKHVFLGIESGVQEVLDRFNKKIKVEQNISAINIIRDLDLSIEIGFIMFDPYTTLDEIIQNINFLQNQFLIDIKALTNKLSVHCGTPILQKLLEENNLFFTDSYEYKYDFINDNIETIYNLYNKLFLPLNNNIIILKKLYFVLDTRDFNQKEKDFLFDRVLLIDREIQKVIANNAKSIVEDIRCELKKEDIEEKHNQLINTQLNQIFNELNFLENKYVDY